MVDLSHLQKLCQLIRYDILTSTTTAGSGHPTSCLSAVELMTTLFFGGFLQYDLKNPKNVFNDRVIFSKGHAAPLLYALYHTAGVLSAKELLTLRKFDSVLEGHPTPRFPYVDVATGSLGQGLSVGVGMALGIKLKMKNEKLKIEREPKVFILLGDSEMTEGQVWEAMEIASYYKLNNLIAIVDVNRLGQRGETILGWDLETYAKRVEAFGWETMVVEDGHDLEKVRKAFNKLMVDNRKPASSFHSPSSKPVMILAKTVKGKGVSFLENQNGWHGKPVPKEQLKGVLKELGKVDLKAKGIIEKPKLKIKNLKLNENLKLEIENYKLNDFVATREAYGDALVALGEADEWIVVLDAEVSNSTYAEKFAKKFPDRFFEMFIAEQNMVSVALGLSKQGFIPFVSTFAAFLTRAFDQIRMAQYSKTNLKLIGSHAGVSIGSDGPSQMGLEDLAMMRSVLNSMVFYPSDAVSCFKLTQIMAQNQGLFYLRTTREKTPVIYDEKEEFKIGGSKILRQSDKDAAVVFVAGITVHEALKAYEELKKQGINIAVVDLYCIKPIDQSTIQQLAAKTKNVIVVEDHYPYGGLGEAVLSALNSKSQITRNKQISNYKFQDTKNLEFETLNIENCLDTWKLEFGHFTHLCVRKLPRSGTPAELLAYEEIDAAAIVKAVKQFSP